MRNHSLAPLVLAVALGTAACATSAEWAVWRDRPTHFASSDHLTFSVRNRDGVPPRVTRQDVKEAQAEGWWGDPVTVSPSQILAR